MKTSSVRDQVSAEEWQTRIDLAAAYRLVALYGWDDHFPFSIFHWPFAEFISRCFVSFRGSFAWLSDEERSTKSHERT